MFTISSTVTSSCANTPSGEAVPAPPARDQALEVSVPEEDVRRRFSRGWDHFETLYKPLVDRWALYDNAGDATMLIASEGTL